MDPKTHHVAPWNTVKTFLKVGACSETLMHVLDRTYGVPALPEEHAASIYAGGIMQRGYQCGMLWGATLAAGAEASRRTDPGSRAEAAALAATQKLVETFHARTGTIDCADITNTEWKSKWQMFLYMAKGGPITCFKLASRYASEAFESIEESLATEPPEAPDEPVSCASMLARRMGMSDRHAAMLAGYAGGIGLSGGGCGALGTALWILALNHLEVLDPDKEQGKNLWDSKEFQTRANEVIEHFLKHSEFEFKCAKITGKTFENLPDHSGYLREGGCGELIEALAQHLEMIRESTKTENTDETPGT